MTKQDLVKKVQESLHLHSQKEAAETLDKVVGVIVESIVAGEEVTLGELGKFTTTTRAARTCRNPKTGEEMQVPEKKAVRFRPAGKMKKAINE